MSEIALSVLLFITIACCSALYIALSIYKKRVFGKVYLSDNIPKGFYQHDTISFLTRAVCLIVSLALLLIALLAPHTKTMKSRLLGQLTAVDEIVFLLDCSASMLATDTSTAKSRFDRAKEIISQVVEEIGGINVSLIGFSGNADVIVAPSNDYLYFRILLDGARINEPGLTGSSFYALFEDLVKMAQDSPFVKSKLYVLLSDGEDTALLDLDAQAKKRGESQIVEKVRVLCEKDARLDVVGLGSPQGVRVPGVLDNGSAVTSRLQKPFLQEIAKAGSGKFFEENEVSLLSIVQNIIQASTIKSTPEKAATELVVTKEATTSLVASFIFILAALFLPQARRKR